MEFEKLCLFAWVKCPQMSYFNSSSVICLINKTMLDVLDQPEYYYMDLFTYVLQNIATSKMMLSRSNTNGPVWLRNENLNL